MSIEAMKRWLECAERCESLDGNYSWADVVSAIKGAIEQAQKQEPVAGQPLPCPFCGHVGLDFSDGNTYRWGIASCGGCGASCGDIRREYPDEGKWHSEAIAEWNKRTAPPPRHPEQAQKQEPVAWMNKHGACMSAVFKEVDATAGEYTTPLYTSPPPRQWVGLTDEERLDLMYESGGNEILAIQITEAKLKEKNT